MTSFKKQPQIESKDIYQQITDQIIEALSQSTDWVMPWHQKRLRLPQNALTQNPYSGVNILSLWIASYKNHYASPLWGTYKQWQALGAHVRKGEKSYPIVFYKDFEVEEKNEETGDLETVKRFVLKASSVFNAAQVEGFDTALEEETLEEKDSFNTYQAVETFVAQTGAKVVHSFSSAFYHQSEDMIGMPERKNFVATETQTAEEGYYGILLHELTHWTGHKNRLNRIIPTARFGSDNYAMEELIAELGAAFLCADLGISATPRQDHANYIAHWLNVLKNDKKAIFYAARQAILAAEFLKAFSKIVTEEV